MRVVWILAIAFIGIMALSQLVSADAQPEQDAVYLTDGSILRGRITDERGDSVTVESTDSWKEVSRSQIQKIVRATSVASSVASNASPTTSNSSQPQQMVLKYEPDESTKKVIETSNNLLIILGVISLVGLVAALAV